MPLTKDETDTLLRLKSRLDRDARDHWVNNQRVPGFKSLRHYYDGLQRLEQLGLAVPEDLRKFTTIVAWPRTYVDAVVSRLRPQGFLLDGEADAEMWRRWQANNLDGEFRMALVDMLVCGRGYLCVGTNEDDAGTPLITVESPLEMIHEWSNRYRKVTVAARFYSEDVAGRKVPKAVLYYPDATIWITMEAGQWEQEGERDEHNLGRVPVHPLVNRGTSDDRYGTSEIIPIIGLTDAAARALTNAQVATEVMALPQRYAAGMTAADFKDPDTGEALSAWESYFGAVWATSSKDAKFGQFSAADLSNFKTIVEMYAGLVANVTRLPMRYFVLRGGSGDAPSEGSIRAEEEGLIGICEEKQEFASDGLEDTQRTADRLVTGEIDLLLVEMVTDWRSPATPTLAQAADGAVKLHAQGLFSRREALRTMGKSPKQIQVIETELREEAFDPITAALAAQVTGNGSTAPAVSQ
ncbi:phage portal protein [Nocardioides aurantiacus]|uniref:phage portal protein n=1 Tax=Nocardioides aurantiacus TaxID=86796 RepID=UPI001476FC8E|nr:phage portal protein [Nocardioides aurantiacus]